MALCWQHGKWVCVVMSAFPPNLYDIMVMILEGGVFGRWPCHDGEAPTMGSVPLRDHRELTKKEGAHQNPSTLAP